MGESMMLGCSKPAGSRTHLTEEPTVDGPSARLEEHLRMLFFLLLCNLGTSRQTGCCCLALGTEQLLQEGRSNEEEVFKLVSDLLGLEKRTREEVVAAAASIRSGVDAQQRREWRGRFARLERPWICLRIGLFLGCCFRLSSRWVDHWRYEVEAAVCPGHNPPPGLAANRSSLPSAATPCVFIWGDFNFIPL